MKRLLYCTLVCLPCLTWGGTGRSQPPGLGRLPQPRENLLGDRIRMYGHRNWIVIADSAYPAQTRSGIETVVTGKDQLAVLTQVLDELSGSKHVRPVIYLDAELPFVPEKDAPGIDRYRADLTKLLGEARPRSVPHEEIITRLDSAGEKYKVLILKTNLALPYTSVFLELDCGYWSPEAEKRLRDAMKK